MSNELAEARSRPRPLASDLSERLGGDRLQEILFVWPACLFLAGLTIYPFLYSLYLSFHRARLTALHRKVFAGLDNYAQLFADPLFLKAIQNTALLVAASLTLEVVIGFVVAKVFYEIVHIRWAGALRSLFLTPMMVTPIIIGVIFNYIFNPTLGVANYLLGRVGVAPVPWFGDVNIAPLAILLINVWQWTPFMMLLILAGLMAIPKSLHEAARVDGAGWLSIVRSIEIPSILGILVLGAILRTIDMLRYFDVIYVTTRGGPGDATEVVTLYAYNQNFQYFQVGAGSAAAVVILAISLVVTTFAVRLLRRMEDA